MRAWRLGLRVGLGKGAGVRVGPLVAGESPMLSKTGDSNLSVFEALSLGPAEENPDSRDSGYDGSNGPVDHANVAGHPTDFAAPFAPAPRLGQPPPAPLHAPRTGGETGRVEEPRVAGYTVPLGKSSSTHSTTSTLSVHEEDPEEGCWDRAEPGSSSVLGAFRDTKSRLLSCPIVAHAKPSIAPCPAAGEPFTHLAPLACPSQPPADGSPA